MGRVVVVGLGVTGDAVVRHAHDAGHEVTVIEDTPRRDPGYRERVRQAVAAGAQVVERPDRDRLAIALAGADLLVPSPGVPEHHPAIAAARVAGVRVRSEIDLAAQRADRPLIAVTGTNGKTTVTSLITTMLQASSVDAIAAGNIGLPLLDAVETEHAVLVAEVSSFQLTFTTAAFRPRVAVLLNLAPDHLDWHGSFAAYAAAKAAVFRHQRGDDLLVFNADDAEVTRVAAGAPANTAPFSIRAEARAGYRIAGGALVDAQGAELASAGEWATAPRDRANALAAAAAARAAGATRTGVEAALAGFEPLPHRLRLAGEGAGVRYYDDSKATNPHATVSAVEAMTAPVVLVAGGRNKGLDLSVLRPLAQRLRGVVTIGEAADDIETVFAGAVPVARARDMRDAVRKATDQARRGDQVVLSPACASFDWYASYEERGDDFRHEVERLLGHLPASAGRSGS